MLAYDVLNGLGVVVESGSEVAHSGLVACLRCSISRDAVIKCGYCAVFSSESEGNVVEEVVCCDVSRVDLVLACCEVVGLVADNEGLTILETSYADEDYAACISKENPELKKAIDAAILKLTEDGTIEGIIAKYIK